MSQYTWQETLVTAKVAGTANTAGTAASCIPTAAKITLPNGFFSPGRMIRVVAQGRISCVVTTPGTARFDVRLGAVVAFDTGALNLNIVAKTNVPWWLVIELACRAEGQTTTANLMGFARFQSEAVIASAANAAGSNGTLIAPVGAPTVGTGFDSSAAQALDLFFTQTVATGSMTLEQYRVESIN